MKKFIEKINANCLLLFNDKNYQPPTKKEVEMFFSYFKITHIKISNITGNKVNTKKFNTSTAIYAWMDEKALKQNIPYCKWRLLLLHYKVVKIS